MGGGCHRAAAAAGRAAISCVWLHDHQWRAGLDRGTLATSAQRTAISVLLKQLEDASQLADMDSTDIEKALAGRWRLIYTTAEVFRCG